MNSISIEEAMYIFPSMADSIRSRVKVISDITGMSKVWGECAKLRQLAEKTSNSWFIVQSLLVLQSAHHYPSTEPWMYILQAVQAMKSVPQQERTHYIIEGRAVVPNYFMVCGIALSTAGKYEEAELIFKQGKQLTDASCRLGCELLQVPYCLYKYCF
jgi:hypothetical protein